MLKDNKSKEFRQTRFNNETETFETQRHAKSSPYLISPSLFPHLGLSPYELTTYMQILGCVDSNGFVQIPRNDLAKKCGISLTTLKKCINALANGNNEKNMSLLTKTECFDPHTGVQLPNVIKVIFIGGFMVIDDDFKNNNGRDREEQHNIYYHAVVQEGRGGVALRNSSDYHKEKAREGGGVAACSAPPSISPPARDSNIYSKSIISKKDIYTTPTPPKPPSCEQPPNAGGLEKTFLGFSISLKNPKGQTVTVSDREISKHFESLPYTTTIIKIAIAEAKRATAPVSNILRYVEAIALRISNKKPSTFKEKKPPMPISQYEKRYFRIEKGVKIYF